MTDRKLTYWIIFFSLFLMSSCKEERVFPPEAIIEANKVEGLTTSIFEFNANKSNNLNDKSNIFYQWDYGVDSVWNTLPSKNPKTTFRYYAPGEYKLNLLVINSEGLTDSASIDIHVELGASQPDASFIYTPIDGHIYTDYLFDASASRDDEDSLNTLKFRWDFQSDGIWDTQFSDDPTASKIFWQENKYQVTLQVQDPTDLSTFIRQDIKVGLLDKDLFVDFNWTPEDGTNEDTIHFDASSCYHSEFPNQKLSYKWKFEEGENWTEYSDVPYIDHRFGTTRTQMVKLTVMEARGVFNTIEKPIYLNQANRPPTANFVLSIPNGNRQTQFFMDAWSSSDKETLPSNLRIRWDFEGDGNWDTQYSLDKKIYHQFKQVGEFNMTMEVIDSEGLTGRHSEVVKVSGFTNQTGIVIDGRDGEIYGTVKLGDQWWMAENLKFEVARKMFQNDRGVSFWDPWEPWKCLEDYPPYCEKYGKYYHIKSGIDNTHLLGEIEEGLEVNYELCPRGWRMPYKEDLVKLIDYVGSDGAGRLAPGGDTDFNLQHLGVINWYITWAGFMQPEDTVYVYEQTYQEAWLFSQEEPENEFRIDVFTLKIMKSQNIIWFGEETTRYFAPIRCIKEE